MVEIYIYIHLFVIFFFIRTYIGHGISFYFPVMVAPWDSTTPRHHQDQGRRCGPRGLCGRLGHWLQGASLRSTRSWSWFHSLLSWEISTRPGKHLHSYGKSPFLMGKSTINGTLLVGGLEHLDYVSIFWEFHHPNWRTPIFQRGRLNHQPVTVIVMGNQVLWARNPWDLGINSSLIHHGFLNKNLRSRTACTGSCATPGASTGARWATSGLEDDQV